MVRDVLRAVALGPWLVGCASSLDAEVREGKDAGTGMEVPDGRDGSEPDAAPRPRDDAGVAEPDAGSDSGPVGCSCVHGSCEDAGTCRCDEGYGGTACDTALFAGSGRDGQLVIAAATDLSVVNHPGRSCADGGDAVAYSVLAFDGDTQAHVTPSPAPGCLAPGDEVLVMNVQGRQGSVDNVGHHEFLEVAEVSGEVVRFARPKTLFYGAAAGSDEGLGTARNTQRVVLQRVPHYESLLLTANQVLTARAWDGARGGVLAVRVKERAVIAGRLDMVARGFQGGAATTTVATTGQAGEGRAGLGVRSQSENTGGGGGGSGQGLGGDTCGGHGYSGAGGGHGELGGESAATACAGRQGSAYGDAQLTHLGAGGGAGGTDHTLDDNPPGGHGGAGGGAIFLFARELYVYGAIDASGAPGQGDASECLDGLGATSCWDYSGPGGGGAGGSIRLEAETFDFGAGDIRALGGAGGGGSDSYATDGGHGGAGRIVIDSHGAELPAACTPEATTL
jgi:hypothetical protein